MAHANSPFHPHVSVDKEMWHLLDAAMAGIHRSRGTIARTASSLKIAQRFLVEGRVAAAAPAFAHELSSLRDVLKRIGAHVADEKVDLAMEVAELDRLSMELHTHGRPVGDDAGARK
jgi:hypothetical protein